MQANNASNTSYGISPFIKSNNGIKKSIIRVAISTPLTNHKDMRCCELSALSKSMGACDKVLAPK
jgi:hypothetical protein